MSDVLKAPYKKARALAIEGSRWWYRVGRAGWTILVWSPAGQKLVTNAGQVLGLPPEVVARGQWKKTSDGMVTPGKIVEWIKAETERAARRVGR